MSPAMTVTVQARARRMWPFMLAMRLNWRWGYNRALHLIRFEYRLGAADRWRPMPIDMDTYDAEWVA